MNALLKAHVGGRLVAIIVGAIAIAARTNESLHAFAGTWFLGSMLVPAPPPQSRPGSIEGACTLSRGQHESNQETFT